MKKLFTLALAAVFGLAGINSFAQAQPKAGDPAVVWGYDYNYNTNEYTPFVPPTVGLASAQNFVLVAGATGVNFGQKNDEGEIEFDAVNATLQIEVTRDGQSVYTEPYVVASTYWDSYNGTQFGRIDLFGWEAPLEGGSDASLEPGNYKVTITLLKVTAEGEDLGWGMYDIHFTSQEVWNDANGNPISLSHEFKLIADPAIRLAYPVCYSGTRNPTFVYDLDELPSFKLEFEDADELGTDYVVVATVRHLATRNMKFFYDTIRTAAGLDYTFAANWKERYNEDPNDEGDEVPETDWNGNPNYDHHSLTLALLMNAGGQWVDITPKEGFQSYIMMYFIDQNLLPAIEWENIAVTGTGTAWDYETDEEYEAWLISSWDNSMPSVLNGVLGVGKGAYMLVLEVVDNKGETLYGKEFTEEPWSIAIPATVPAGTYTAGLYLKRFKADGTAEPVFDAEGNPVKAAYWLVLGEGEFPTEEPVYNPDLTIPGEANEAAVLVGVKAYPNPSNGMFYVTAPEAATVEIFAVNGALVARGQMNAGVKALRIDRSGIYFVRVSAGNRTAVQRVIIK